MVKSDKKYTTEVKTETDYLAVITTIILVITLIYLCLIAYLFSRISSGNFDAGGYYSAMFWITIILIIVLVALLGYSAYRTFTGNTSVVNKEIDHSESKAQLKEIPESEQTHEPKSMTQPQKLSEQQRLSQDRLSQEQRLMQAQHSSEQRALDAKHQQEQLALQRQQSFQRTPSSTLPPTSYSSRSLPTTSYSSPPPVSYSQGSYSPSLSYGAPRLLPAQQQALDYASSITE